ncbi:hypothetical protein K2X85_06740 [bacterium]|nr:hypothetical protein [bacterium]
MAEQAFTRKKPACADRWLLRRDKAYRLSKLCHQTLPQTIGLFHAAENEFAVDRRVCADWTHISTIAGGLIR